MLGANTQPDRGLLRRPMVARLILLALFAEIGYAVLNISTMPVYLAFDRGFGASLIGLIIVVFLLSEAIFKGPMGALADRIGHRKLMVAGPALTVLTSLATMAVPRIDSPAETLMLMGLRALDGLGAAMLWPAAFAMIGDAVPDGERQQAMSLMNTAYLLGIALALPFGGLVNDFYGDALASTLGSRSPGLLLAALMFLIVSLMAAWKLPDLVHKPKPNEDGEVTPTGLLMAMRNIPEYLVIAIVTFAGVGFPMAIVKLFAEEQFRMSETAFGALVLPIALAMAVMSVPMAKLGERLGRARAVHWGLGMCAVGMAAIALGAFLPFMRMPLVIAVGGLPVAFGFLLTIPAWMASVSDIDPQRRAVYLGAVMTAQGVGAIIGAPLGSLMYERLQGFGVQVGLGADLGRYSPFVGCAVCVLLGWLVSLKVLRDYRTAPQ